MFYVEVPFLRSRSLVAPALTCSGVSLNEITVPCSADFGHPRVREGPHRSGQGSLKVISEGMSASKQEPRDAGVPSGFPSNQAGNPQSAGGLGPQPTLNVSPLRTSPVRHGSRFAPPQVFRMETPRSVVLWQNSDSFAIRPQKTSSKTANIGGTPKEK